MKRIFLVLIPFVAFVGYSQQGVKVVNPANNPVQTKIVNPINVVIVTPTPTSTFTPTPTPTP